MYYSEFKGHKLSALDMGCMRLPVIDGDFSRIDEAAVEEMVAYAFEHGINYFDVAWGYHGKNCEPVMGKVLSKYPRESYYLASKFPGYDLANINKVEEIFEQQLKKCGVDYFDFYMFHNVCELNIDEYLDPKYRIYDYLIEQKRNGRIKHLGCSVHGNLETMRRFFDAYGNDMEFCQLQLNWLDWSFQSGREKVRMLRELGIPVWVMEPLRGGKIVKIPAEYENSLKELAPDRTMPEWAFRFLQSLGDDVKVTLSGMSNMEQLRQNIDFYEQKKPLPADEMNTLLNVALDMTKVNTVPCTACRYCVDHCPQGLDIPWLLELYNEHNFSGGGFLAPMAIDALEESKKPTACISCRSCEAVCPQTIKISEVLSTFAPELS